MGYDIIGDIHGHDEKLVALLKLLGYVERSDAWRHPSHTAIFVGDFIDRGPGQMATLDIVRAMVEGGSALALMGNHEFNAIAYWTEDREADGHHLRMRNAKNTRQHQHFLAEVEADSARHAAIVAWFKTLPLWLDLPALRVVHACWHPACMRLIAPLLGPKHTLTDELLVAASREGRPEYAAVEILLKGPEIPLPPGIGYMDADGHHRTRVRTKWWDAQARTYRAAALLDEEIRRTLPVTELPADLVLGYTDDIPLFFGHYWHTGEPAPLAERIACVDYSAGKDGPLVAYRWHGERRLSAAGFCQAGG